LSRRVFKGLSAGLSGLVMVVAPIGNAAAHADVTAAYTYEWNDAVATGVPMPNPGGGCVDVTGAEGCFEPNGDKFYVKDTKGDGSPRSPEICPRRAGERDASNGSVIGHEVPVSCQVYEPLPSFAMS
jgi:hypothetical protein